MEVLNNIIKFITEDYWSYIADTSVITSEKVVAGVVGFTIFLLIAFFGIIGSTIHYTDEIIRHYKNIAKPVLAKLKLNMMKFEFRYLYIPHLESPAESVTEEYHHIIGGVKPGMSLDPEVYNSIMKEHNRTLMNVLSSGSVGLLEEYMEEPMYLNIAFKKNIEDTYTVYAFKDGNPHNSVSVSTKYFKKFKKHKRFWRMNFGCCKVPVIVITEYGGANPCENIIRNDHDMNIYSHIWNNICYCISRWVPVMAICVNAPRADGGFICETSDGEWYRSRVNAHFFIDKHFVCLRDDDNLMSKEDMETMFNHFHTRENLMDMIGSDYALDIKTMEEKKVEKVPEEIQRGGIILHPITPDTMIAMSDKAKADGKGPIDVEFYTSVDDAFDAIEKDTTIITGSIIIICEDGNQIMYNVVRAYRPIYTLKQIDREYFNRYVSILYADMDFSVWRYPTLESFHKAYKRGNIGVTLNKDVLVVELKDLPDEYYLIRS